MEKEKWIHIGQLLKPVGTNGEIKVEIDEVFWDDLSKIDHVFIKKNGHYVPYFIENLRETNHILIKFEEVDSPEEAATFTLQDIYIIEKDIQSKTYLHQKSKLDWVNYLIYAHDNSIGTIENIEIYPHQVMASVLHQGKNILIPLVDEWIISVDDTKKTIIMELPDGLLDV